MALLFIFFNLPWGSLSKFFQFMKFVQPIFQKPKKKKGLQRRFSRYWQFCVFFLYLKFGAMNFLSTGTKKGTNMFNDPVNMNFAKIYI